MNLYRFSAIVLFFFFNDTATTEIYTLSLHDALPISVQAERQRPGGPGPAGPGLRGDPLHLGVAAPLRAESSFLQRSSGERSEEHTSELQSQSNLVCRLLLEKKKCKTGQRLRP